jgi:hypothetical protein
MRVFKKLLSPEEAHILMPDIPLEEFYECAKSGVRCVECGDPSWRIIGSSLCFTCTTGETDSSGEYELRQL